MCILISSLYCPTLFENFEQNYVLHKYSDFVKMSDHYVEANPVFLFWIYIQNTPFRQSLFSKKGPGPLECNLDRI